jgi:ribosomal protein S17E
LDKVNPWNTYDVKNYFNDIDSFESRKKSVEQVSDKTSQNIIYRIAREFHGYQ